MTWQRIDENTYIDDTLVTCAEYQLFIDEMREQKKYYQPDHWTSYLFPQGQAREPILGVLGRDAQAFCDWLMQIYSKGSVYRLPTYNEAINYPIKISAQKIMGYWTADGEYSYNEEEQLLEWIELPYDFIWVSAKTNDPRGITHIMKHTFTFDRIQALDIGIERENYRAMISMVDRSINNKPVRRDAKYHLERFDRKLVQDRDLNLKSEIAKCYDTIISIARNPEHSGKGALEFTIGVYTELLTLQERIAGRSPAFEGIRLVKERIR